MKLYKEQCSIDARHRIDDNYMELSLPAAVVISSSVASQLTSRSFLH